MLRVCVGCSFLCFGVAVCCAVSSCVMLVRVGVQCVVCVCVCSVCCLCVVRLGTRKKPWVFAFSVKTLFPIRKSIFHDEGVPVCLFVCLCATLGLEIQDFLICDAISDPSVVGSEIPSACQPFFVFKGLSSYRPDPATASLQASSSTGGVFLTSAVSSSLKMSEKSSTYFSMVSSAHVFCTGSCQIDGVAFC